MNIEKNNFPKIIYGTAWKKADTARLVELAVTSGFTAIDTANQPKHYNELLVGEALNKLKQKNIGRGQLFLQTKFTPLDSQDEPVPYDSTASLTEQVQASFYSSLQHLDTEYIDSYLLHGPYNWPGLGAQDWEIWQAIEDIYLSRKIKWIGVSNFNAHQLALLVENANIKPMIVQNRCFADKGWDKEVRDYCNLHGIIYQGFSLLTANPAIVNSPQVRAIAYRYNKTTAQIIFRFANQIGIVPLTGTTNPEHMLQDLSIYDFELTQDEIISIFSSKGMVM